ncbi:alpha-ketoacid dehydrogenase subunit alpha/beta [Jejuia pallidilutea]|jgi:pyruvate/2-oxoglutarate/acetoin dehydrogenase E1 component/TPP-dependent pyruvate/acetoin dehydrogenase alpha subunit|uniref:3-methyl-2-oxobutanoate dehydrogenase (2-methylpropanoyl-transferring) n=2 Tax=Jejuia pallidilutea TaxID=504487 RepID=A0A098LU79_9FLAO|nr:alpha-ketoacid dehydrogenase subunit alpha/beta [Jejuia pallidilutea]GAL89962.1 branched-chain alpha-keto acid dehydrogenase [Jejuia pallidilutea]
MQSLTDLKDNISFDDFKAEVLNDYKIAVQSRECSLLGRREVLTGKAKFGIFGDGKEVPQLAMAKAFKKGDWRSGYYRDQTFMMAIGELTVEQFFAGLYANTNLELEPMSAGRQMGGHFVTHSIDENGNWKDLTKQYNSSADISPTAGQMPRLLGLAQASKVFKELKDINAKRFSVNGNEVAWGTIGNASTSEGLFFETINAAGVLQVPMVTSIWDDEYGISVHAKYQTTKENISEILKGFQRDKTHKGFEILRVKGWDYANLIETYQEASIIAREEHVPVLIHVTELTQPQGHSTSGSHERYKSGERLQWESAHDCNKKMREWIIESGIATNETLTDIERTIKREVKQSKTKAWNTFLAPIKKEQKEIIDLLEKLAKTNTNGVFISKLKDTLAAINEPTRKDILSNARKAIRYTIGETSEESTKLKKWINKNIKEQQPEFSSHLFCETDRSALNVSEVKPIFDDASELVDGRIIIRDNFDTIFNKYPETLIFGEDTGNIGDVNQGLEGLQAKYGELRVADTGIREATIIGQGIGMALRGLRPIAEIQYLDYVLYALHVISDDLATLHYRTKGRQKAPLIIRTRGHRLEGIWHSGSQMGGLLNLIRGVLVLVPRNMTKAAGFYNTLLEGDDPALVVECLNGYRLKERRPNNMGNFKTPIGVVETLKEGTDITLVSYGSTLRLVEQAAKELLSVGIDAEVIDIQSLIPFDIHHDIVKSIAKTNRVMVIDEDVPGGASAYILDKILNTQNAFQYLDGSPKTLSAKPHRPAYGNDGDYFSKPSVEDIFEAVYEVMHELSPSDFPKLR